MVLLVASREDGVVKKEKKTRQARSSKNFLVALFFFSVPVKPSNAVSTHEFKPIG